MRRTKRTGLPEPVKGFRDALIPTISIGIVKYFSRTLDKLKKELYHTKHICFICFDIPYFGVFKEIGLEQNRR